MESKKVLCTRCGEHPWMHEVYSWWKDPPDEFLCCRCFVKEGGTPADWHPECMKAAKEQEGAIEKADIPIRM